MKKIYINCQGQRTVGKANKGINVEKIIIGLKIFKLTFKKREREKKKKEENSMELQKPNIEAGVYNTNKKCD